MRSAITLIFCLLLVACEEFTDDSPVAMGTLEVDRVSLAADSTEPFIGIDVVEGDRVTPGMVLARQDAARFNVALKAARAELAVARARLAQAEAGPRQQDIAAARAKVAAATSNMKTLRVELDRERSLVRKNYASQSQVDILEGRYEEAVANREEAEARLEQLLEGTRSEEIDAARSTYALAEAKVEDIEISLDRAAMKAPVAGTIESVLYEIGERPRTGDAVIAILRDQAPYARVHVPEPLRTRLSTGAPAEISIDGHTKAYRGRLRWIARDASFTPYFALTQHDRSHLSYLAEIDLVDEAPDVATGVPVEVRFPGIEGH